MEELYAALDARITERSPTCINRGVCCKFGSFGHRLYVTSAELAYFLAKADFPPDKTIELAACPYQVEGLCTVRVARPTGCRVFFCQAADQHWQSAETEGTLEEIKALHVRFDLPYAYVEWTAALRTLAPADSESG